VLVKGMDTHKSEKQKDEERRGTHAENDYGVQYDKNKESTEDDRT